MSVDHATADNSNDEEEEQVAASNYKFSVGQFVFLSDSNDKKHKACILKLPTPQTNMYEILT